MLLVKKSDTPTLGQIVSIPIDSVKTWKDNPRKNETAAGKLMQLLDLHGQVSPIVVWDHNRVIYKGNTTWKAMKLRGDTTIKAVFVDFPSEQAAIAYGIADNKSSEWSDWDDDILRKFLTVDNFKSTGFTEKETRKVLVNGDWNAIDKITEDQDGKKGNILVLVVNESEKEDIRQLLLTWIDVNNINVEVK